MHPWADWNVPEAYNKQSGSLSTFLHLLLRMSKVRMREVRGAWQRELHYIIVAVHPHLQHHQLQSARHYSARTKRYKNSPLPMRTGFQEA